MGTYARVNTTTGAILEHVDQPGFNPTVGTKAGTKWVPLIPSNAGTGPVHVSTTETVVMGANTYEGRQFDRKVSRVSTYREKTPAEVEADKDQRVDDSEEYVLQDRINFKIINEIRVLQAKPLLTPADYKAWKRTLL